MKLINIKSGFIWVIVFLINIESIFAVERKSKAVSDQVLSDPIGASHFFQMFLGLFLIVVLMFGLAWLVKRINTFQGNLNGVLKVLSMISVGQREKVALIQVGQKQLLIGVASGKVNTLLVLDEEIDTNNPIITQSGFAEKLSAVLKGKVTRS